MRVWGYVQRTQWGSSGRFLWLQERPSTPVRPVDVVLLHSDAPGQPAVLPRFQALREGDMVVVNKAALLAYPDGPGLVLPDLMDCEVLVGLDQERVVREMQGMAPEVRLKGTILPTEEPAAISPVPHILCHGDELLFTQGMASAS